MLTGAVDLDIFMHGLSRGIKDTCALLGKCPQGRQWEQQGPAHRGRPLPAHCTPAALPAEALPPDRPHVHHAWL